MGHLLKLCQGSATNPCCRRCRKEQLGKLIFQLLQLPEKRVVLGIADLRGIIFVVKPVVSLDLSAEKGDMLFGRGVVHEGLLRKGGNWWRMIAEKRRGSYCSSFPSSLVSPSGMVSGCGGQPGIYRLACMKSSVQSWVSAPPLKAQSPQQSHRYRFLCPAKSCFSQACLDPYILLFGLHNCNPQQRQCIPFYQPLTLAR